MIHQRRAIALAAAFALALSPTLAQVFGSAIDISVLSGSASSAQQLPTASGYPLIILTPGYGTATDVRFLIGGSGVTATTSSPVLPPNGMCMNPANGSYISTWGVSGTATVHVTAVTQCPLLAKYHAPSGSPPPSCPNALVFNQPCDSQYIGARIAGL